MIYSNTNPMAISAMEEHRTGHYGEDFYNDKTKSFCPICGETEPTYFYYDYNDDCVGCDCCICKKLIND